MTLLASLVETSERLAALSARSAKAAELARLLRSLHAEEMEIGAAYLSGTTPQGKLGVGYSQLHAARETTPAALPSLRLLEAHARLNQIAATSGRGSTALRKALLRELFARATAPEQDFLMRLAVGELRQGALEGLMLDAIAAASSLPAPAIRRAAMYAGSLGAVARAALSEGLGGLEAFRLKPLAPVAPMLAQSAEDVAQALQALGAAAFEWKLDGARVQAHKSADRVIVYTRTLNDVTAALPEVVAALESLPARSVVLDGETIALRADGRPRAFQDTMRRFGRKLDVEALRAELPLAVFFFDCLHIEGQDLVDRPASERFAALERNLPGDLLTPRLITGDLAGAEAFYADAIGRGHEGVMAKSLASPYEAGRRGAGWLKIKRTRTLDLVVLAAEWGHGRRKAWLSNLHLGARDPAGGYVMLGKTFKGLTDEMLAWQTQAFLAREVKRDAWTVWIRPELVVEIAFNDLQASPHYPGGMALRFARVKGYRPDKTPREADTIDTVRAIFASRSS